MSHEYGTILSDMNNNFERKLGDIAAELFIANKLKAIELYKKVDPKILENLEIQNFLRKIANIK